MAKPRIGFDAGYLYDHSIEIEIKILPDALRVLIEELEEYDKIGDWINYDLKESLLESELKTYVNNNLISENMYKLLLRKYGWLTYD